MRIRRIPMSAPALAAALALTAAAPLAAQSTAVLEGQVTEYETGRPLPQVRVGIDGTDLRTVTNSSGWFRLTGVPGGRVQLRVDLDGYGAVVEPIDVKAGAVTLIDFRMTGVATLLDQVMVMAESDGPELQDRDQGATIRRIESASATRNGHYSLGELLRGRIPGLNVTQSGGQIGSSFRMLLRGVKSISLGNDPLIYLDGVLLSSPTNQRGDRFGGGNALDLIDPFSIDHIEVLSGPAASVRYGAGAANGVILLYSKRGNRP